MSLYSAYICSAELWLLEDGVSSFNRVEGTMAANGACAPTAGISLVAQWSADANVVTVNTGYQVLFEGTLVNGVLTLDENGTTRRWVFTKKD